MELQNIFTAVCNMTVTGSIVIGCVLAARLALARAPKVFPWMLWLVVLFRLLCPVSVPGPASVLELVDPPRSASGTMEYLELPVQAPVQTTTPVEGVAHPGPAERPIDWSKIGTYVWAGGAGALLAYGIISYVNLKRKLRESVPLGKGIRETDRIVSPFVLGRTIYLPAGLKTEELGCILLHEQLHIRHGDHIVKALFWLAVCLHWFNPLVWLGFFLCGRDMELRCDEAVLKHLGPQVRSGYAQSLLDLATGRSFVPAPLAFGEGGTGKRVRFVLKWKKAKLWIAVPAAVLCAVVLMLTACDPADNSYGEQYLFDRHYRAEAVLGDGSALPEQIYELWAYDQSLHLRTGSDVWRLTGLERKSLIGFDLTDDELEKTLREENLCAWRFTDAQGWLLRQDDLSVWLVFGTDTVQRLDPTDRVRTKLIGSTGPTPEPVSYYTGGSQEVLDRLQGMTLTGPETLVFQANSDDTELTVLEEYHNLQSGKKIVKEQTHTLKRTRDYGFELPVEGKPGDYILYRVELGLSTYVFRVNFKSAAVTREVRYAEHGVCITLQLPESWSCAITSIDAAELDAGISAGITFWPRGREEGKLRFEYYPQGFAVCGTGLETADAIVAGRNASLGTYDGEPLWTFISFGHDFAVWGEGHEHWWAEYGDQAMGILNSAEFDLQD